MLIREFMTWCDNADAEARADAAGALARAYLYDELGAARSSEIERVLTLLLDDPSPLVRRVLAEVFAIAVDAPRHILSALSADRSDIAAIVLERSLLLTDAELIDAVAVGDETARHAVARRPRLSAALVGAIAAVADVGAVIATARNAGAELTDFAVQRMIERFGTEAILRDALLRREDVGAEMRHALVVATAEALGRFTVGCGWIAPERIDRILSESRDRAAILLASSDTCADFEPRRFVAHLRSSGHLTPVLILRIILSGHRPLFEAVLCELSGRSEAQVGGCLRNPAGLAFTGLYKATALPLALLPVVRAALTATCRTEPATGEGARLDARIVERALDACADDSGERLASLLRRFQTEATRDLARGEAAPAEAPHRRVRLPQVRREPPPLLTGVIRDAA